MAPSGGFAPRVGDSRTTQLHFQRAAWPHVPWIVAVGVRCGPLAPPALPVNGRPRLRSCRRARPWRPCPSAERLPDEDLVGALAAGDDAGLELAAGPWRPCRPLRRGPGHRFLRGGRGGHADQPHARHDTQSQATHDAHLPFFTCQTLVRGTGIPLTALVGSTHDSTSAATWCQRAGPFHAARRRCRVVRQCGRGSRRLPG